MIDEIQFKKHYLAVVKEVEALRKEVISLNEDRKKLLELQGMYLTQKAEIEAMKKTIHAHTMLLVDFDGEKRTPEALEFHEATSEFEDRAKEMLTPPEDNLQTELDKI